MLRMILAIAAVSFAAAAAPAGPLAPRGGWEVIDTRHPFPVLSERLEAAIKAEKMVAVTTASASEGAKAAGIAIPGNRVVGVFRNDFARRMLAASIAAGIEAPIRFYLTENADGSATLSYKRPSTVFAPYADEGNGALKSLAGELDVVFARIAGEATKANKAP